MDDQRQKEFYATQSIEQLEKHVVDLKEERNAYLKTISDYQALSSGVSHKIELIMSELGKRNYEAMIKDFVLTKDHMTLLLEYGNNPNEIADSDLQIAELLKWKVDDNGLTDDQERRIAQLIAELSYAQDYINRTLNDKLFRKGA